MNLNYPTRSDHYDLINVFNANFSEIVNKTINGDTNYGGTIVSNLNTIEKTGFYTSYGTATGAPSTSYSWFIEHINSNAGTVSAYQRAVAYSTNVIIYERTKQSGTWGNWVLNNSSTTSSDLGNPNSNLGTITTHKILKRNGVCEYKLSANSGTWTAGTSYTVATLDAAYRPIEHVREERRINDVSFGYFFISSITGAITITPRTSITNSSLAIDKTFLT